MATASSTFEGSEDPLSESGAFVSGAGSFGDVKKVSGVLRVSTGNTDSIARAATSFGDAQYSEITIQFTALNDTWPAAATRIASTTDGDCYLIAYDNDSGGSSGGHMYRAGDTGTLTFTQLGADITMTLVSGDVLRLESDGSTHTVFKNGSSVTSRTDATYSSGQPGPQLWAQVNTADAITAWGGGDLATTFSPLDDWGTTGFFGI